MTEEIAVTIFASSWFLLLFIAVLAQIVYIDKIKKSAGLLTNVIVITPFVVVFILYYLGKYFGSYISPVVLRIAGALIVVIGLLGYISCHFYLKRNWSLSASIKEGHELIKNGPYKFIRHPMYSFMTLLVFGSGLLLSNYMMIIFTPTIGIIYYARAKKEEKLLIKEFAEYEQYAIKTKMFIPRIL